MEDRELERRVTQGEDGAYHWTYCLDMWHNPFIFKMGLKIMFWIGLGAGLFATALGNWGSVSGLVMGLIFFAGFILLWLLIYGIWGLCVHGETRIFFAMNDECILQTSFTEKSRDVTNALSVLALVAGVASGHAGQAMRTTANLQNASRDTPTYFSGVKGIVEQRDKGIIVLKNLVTRFRVLVPEEDYDFVLEHIRAHVPEWVLDDKEVEERSRGRKSRLWIAAAVALGLNLITVPINLAAYKATGYLKLSWNLRGGDYGVQRAFGMLAEHWYSTEAPFEHRLSFHLVYTVFFFLIAFLVLWLMLTIVAAIQRKMVK